MEKLLTSLVLEGKESIDKGRLNVSSCLYPAANVCFTFIPLPHAAAPIPRCQGAYRSRTSSVFAAALEEAKFGKFVQHCADNLSNREFRQAGSSICSLYRVYTQLAAVRADAIQQQVPETTRWKRFLVNKGQSPGYGV
jgi:hypothetical protein